MQRRTQVLTLALSFAATAAAVPTATQARGAINAVTASAAGADYATVFTVRGTNPCGAVHVDHGDGQAITHPIERLPAVVRHEYVEAGDYVVRARGMGNCAGEAAVRLSVTRVRPAPAPVAVPNPPAGQRGRGTAIRFAEMDANRDGRIARAEWRGSAQSFRVHDWNSDGVLSGEEVRVGGRRQQDTDPDYTPGRNVVDDWSERRFTNLDHNNDSRIARAEWPFAYEVFVRADRNRDGNLSRTEFTEVDFDDDRADQFDFLDLNGNERIERTEWHDSVEAFKWLDRDGNGVLSRLEVVGDETGDSDDFTSLDINRDRSISVNEWQWSRASFDRLDVNRDGRLSVIEFDAAGPFGPTGPTGPAGRTGAPGSTGTAGTAVSRPIVVSALDRWTDTAIWVQAGQQVTITATGTIQLSADRADIADPTGARSGRTAPDAPVRDRPAGALIARIGNSAPLALGPRGTLRVPHDGRLYLGVNDDHLPDNSGEFRVTIRR